MDPNVCNLFDEVLKCVDDMESRSSECWECRTDADSAARQQRDDEVEQCLLPLEGLIAAHQECAVATDLRFAPLEALTAAQQEHAAQVDRRLESLEVFSATHYSATVVTDNCGVSLQRPHL